MTLTHHSTGPSKTRTTAREGLPRPCWGSCSPRGGLFSRGRTEIDGKSFQQSPGCPTLLSLPAPSACYCPAHTRTRTHTFWAHCTRPALPQSCGRKPSTRSGANWNSVHSPLGPHSWGQSSLPSPRPGSSHHLEQPRLHFNLQGRKSLSRAPARFILPSPAHTTRRGCFGPPSGYCPSHVTQHFCLWGQLQTLTARPRGRPAMNQHPHSLSRAQTLSWTPQNCPLGPTGPRKTLPLSPRSSSPQPLSTFGKQKINIHMSALISTNCLSSSLPPPASVLIAHFA